MAWRLPARGLWLVLVACVLAACARPQMLQRESYVFGTRVDILIHGAPATSAEAAVAEVLREFDRLHRAYHAWEPSELTALNEAIARGERHPVSAELADLLIDARRIALLGDGLFEPAIGALIGLWGFHTDQFAARLPADEDRQALLAGRPRIAELQIEAQADGHWVSSPNRAVRLDLGGYAKGYALDRAAAILRAHGIRNALINIGGNVMALGDKGGEPWRVGVQHPREPRPLATLPLYDGEAVGTSGDYQRFFELDGRRYPHLLDPRTGWPATASQSLSVLVTPRDKAGTLSDAVSKPAFIDGEHWRQHLAAFDIAHGLRVDAEGQIEVSRALLARLKFAPGVSAGRVLD